MSEFMLHQDIGVAWLLPRPRALIADAPGLGKTATAIATIIARGCDSADIICPASVIPVWKREIARFDPGHEKRKYRISSWAKIPKDDLGGRRALILDESHFAKQRTAARTKAVYGEKCDGDSRLMAGAVCVHPMSGTPMLKAPNDLWPMLRAVMPNAIESSGKPMNWWQFQNRFCTVKATGFGDQVTGGKNLAELKERMLPFLLRRTAGDVRLNLPPLTIDTIPLDGRAVTDAIAERVLAEGGIDALRDNTAHLSRVRAELGAAKAEAAALWAANLLDGGVEKLVLFAHHRTVIATLREELSRFRPVGIDGSASEKDRERAVREFQEGASRVFIGQISAAGVGITLTAANVVALVEQSWTPAENEQAIKRVLRIGQRAACYAYFLAVEGSLDQRIAEICARKARDGLALFA